MEKFKEEFKRQLIVRHNCKNVDVSITDEIFHLTGDIDGCKLQYEICGYVIVKNHLTNLLRGIDENISVAIIVNEFLETITNNLEELKEKEKVYTVFKKLKNFLKINQINNGKK